MPVLLRRLLWGFASVLIGVPLLYLLVALVLGSIPVNPDFRTTPSGYTVFVRTNGVHVTLLLPADSPYTTWRRDFPLSDLRGLEQPQPYIAFGWGDRDFMAETPRWSDIKPLTALRAISGLGQGAMHIEYVPRPQPGDAIALRLTPAQFGPLAAYVRSSFARDEKGRPIRLDVRPYGASDAFYLARVNYSPWMTCNEWSRRALAAGQVRVPLWSPFDKAILWQLREFK
ncbi:MAG: TIGR02117 family protein [Betaproteobacteria bacterium]|jgi:uncharacterized protein (TIGR02117 family)